MAHFQTLAGEGIGTLEIPIGARTQVDQWGGGPDNKPLSLSSSDTTILEIVARQPLPGHIQRVTLLGKKESSAEIRATVQSGPEAGKSWSEPLRVIVAPAIAPNLSRMIQNGQVTFNQTADQRAVAAIAKGEPVAGHRVGLTTGLQKLLIALGTKGKVNIMSLYRYGQGPHGVIQPDGSAICQGVDIAGFNGKPVTLGNKSEAIRVVQDIIGSFPVGRYDLGFPRPVGGPTGFDPPSDVFFPVRNLETARKCFDGKIALSISVMLQPAQDKIKEAMGKTPAFFPIMYPDGLNHLHIKVN